MPDFDEEAKNLKLTKNDDGSIRVTASVKATNVKTCALMTDMLKIRSIDCTDKGNEMSYSCTFDLKMEKGRPVIKPILGEDPKFSFDLRGNTLSVTAQDMVDELWK